MALDLLTSVFTRLRPRLHSTARRLLESDDDADDAVQEAFCRLWQRRDRLSGESEAEGVSVTTVRNICIDSLRQRQSRPTDQLDESSDRPDDTGTSPPLQELVEEVNTLISASLSARDREILIHRECDGWEFDEIAEHYGMTEASVRVAISRARRTVRQCYINKHRRQ
ncbi:MAG: sigma-70 family RNA polymerase sigma factor [Duncaniella sp.]|nr:sigma-70 family RNA polymerase sigma factor [Duncaniella sp.]